MSPFVIVTTHFSTSVGKYSVKGKFVTYENQPTALKGKKTPEDVFTFLLQEVVTLSLIIDVK